MPWGINPARLRWSVETGIPAARSFGGVGDPREPRAFPVARCRAQCPRVGVGLMTRAERRGRQTPRKAPQPMPDGLLRASNLGAGARISEVVVFVGPPENPDRAKEDSGKP